MLDNWEFDREKTYGNGFAAVTVRCPFFRNHGKREIHCDSAYGEDAVCILRFRTIELKNQHLKTWCQDHYECCEWYQQMMELNNPDG